MEGLFTDNELEMQEFLDKEGLKKEDLVDMKPIMLISKHLNNEESTENTKLLH